MLASLLHVLELGGIRGELGAVSTLSGDLLVAVHVMHAQEVQHVAEPERFAPEQKRVVDTEVEGEK